MQTRDFTSGIIRLLLLLGAGAGLAGCGPAAVAPCGESPGAVCGFDNPEDAALLTGPSAENPEAAMTAASFVLVVNGGRSDAARWFDLIDTDTDAVIAPTWREPAPSGACAPPANRRPRGFDARALDPGRWTLAAISDGRDERGVNQRIELFELARDAAGWALRWTDCVAVPPAYFLNDVALGPGTLFATHMFDRPAGWRAWLLRPAFVLGLDTGRAVMWDAAQGWRRVAGSHGAFPNGIAVDPTGSVLFVAYTYAAAVARLDLVAGTRADVTLPLRPDNLTWSEDPETKAAVLIAAGATGVPVLSTAGCETLARPGCGFDFKVAEIDAASLAVRPLFAHDRHAVPGASVAVRHGETLYLGTAFGDRVTVVETQ
jgi:hypothetical protein